MKIKHRLALIVVVPMVALLALSGLIISQQVASTSASQTIETNIRSATVASDLVHALQVERGASSLFIASRGERFSNELSAARAVTDEAIFNYVLIEESLPAVSTEAAQQIARDLAIVGEIRSSIDSLDVTASELGGAYTKVIMDVIDLASVLAAETDDLRAARLAIAFIGVMRAKEFAGRERAAGSAGFASGVFTSRQYVSFVNLAAIQDAYIDDAINNVPEELRARVEALRSSGEVQDMREAARRTAFGSPATVKPEDWFAATTDRINAMKVLDDEVGAAVIELAEATAAQATTRVIGFSIGLAAMALLSAGLANIQSRRISQPMGRFASVLDRIAAQDYKFELVDQHRSDEIGQFSRAIKGVQESLIAAEATQIESRFKGAAFASADTPMFVVDADFVVTYTNNASDRLFTEMAEALKSEVPTFDPSKVIGNKLSVFQDKISKEKERLSDAAKLPFNRDIVFGDARIGVQVAGIFDEDGAHIGNVISWNDVTRQRTNSSMLAAADTSQAIIEFTLDGMIVNANQNFLNAVEYTLDEIKGKHHSIFVDREYAQSAEYKEFWRNLGSGGTLNGEFKRVKKSGEDLWILANYCAALDDNGDPFKVIKFATDITAEKALRAKSSSQLKAIQKSQAVIEFEIDGTIVDANDNFLAFMGYERDEIVGKHHSMFTPSETASSEDYRDFWRRLGQGESIDGEFVRVGNGGKTVHLRAGYNPITDEAGKVVRVMEIANDITADFEKRAEADRLREKHSAELSTVVSALSVGLTSLSDGDLTTELTDDFADEYKQLKDDFNRAVKNLNSLISTVALGVGQIGTNSTEVAQAADNLSQRTESQAATLEETAAALEQLTASVKSATDGAKKADRVVSEAKDNAEASGEVVQQAVSAMGEIEKSSSQISQIIGVIDDIAFQTNLLALNAGVEAARAGEAGRGFAVVASEVRALAQRSSDAAKEIKTLISESSQQVESGVELVGRAGEALKEILGSVGDIHKLVSEIANSSNEQSIGISEINTAVGQMDQSTQQNAAMVEETTAACHSMSEETKDLVATVNRFKTDAEGANDEEWRKVEKEATPTPKATVAPPKPTRQPVVGSAALDLTADEDDDGWEDF